MRMNQKKYHNEFLEINMLIISNLDILKKFVILTF
jgi:hypothetical protein